MSIDIFNTRTMLRALEERRPPKLFLTNTFFPAVETSDTEHVDIDVIRNKRRLAPFVHPLAEGKLVERQGFSTKSFKPPYLKPKMVTTAADLLKRSIGEAVYATKTPAQRAAEQLSKDLAEMDDMIWRRIEWMAASALFTDQIVVAGEGVSATIDFGRASSHEITLASGVKWNQAGGDIISDLRDWKSLVAQDTGLVPNICIMGHDVVEVFLADADVVAILGRFSNQTVTAAMDTKNLEDGVTYIGRVEGLDIYSYEEWYLDSNGTEQPLVPADKVLLASTRARRAVHFGAILDLDAGGVAAVPRFPKSWRTPDPSAQWVMLQSSPIVVPTQVDASLVADVI